LWLSGIHTRTSMKADSKVLSGSDLRDALDPLGDQSYYFTAARSLSDVGTRNLIVGLSPRRSRVWVGPSRDWEECARTITDLLTTLEAVEGSERSDETPIPVLAGPLTSAADVRGAFDVSVVGPESLAEETADPDVAER